MLAVTDTYRRCLLASRPVGLADDTTVRLDTTAPVPEPAEGQALVRVRYLSIDPTIRTWMDDAPGYLPPIGIGEVVRGGGIGEVVSSPQRPLRPGDLVFGMTGWQEYVLADEGRGPMTTLPAGGGAGAGPQRLRRHRAHRLFRPVRHRGPAARRHGGGLGCRRGHRFGGRPARPDRRRRHGGGHRRIRRRSAPGSPASSGSTTPSTTGEEDVGRRVRELCPDGIDVFFDNVGGEILDACLANLAMKARVVLCGAISQYNEDRPAGSSQLPEPHHQARPHGGVPRPRLPGPVPRGPGGDGRVGDGRGHQAP